MHLKEALVQRNLITLLYGKIILKKRNMKNYLFQLKKAKKE